MNECSRGSVCLDDDQSRRFEAAHAETDTVDDGVIVTLLAHSEQVDESEITVEDQIPTDNAARPKSIVMGACTIEGEHFMFEFLANERVDTSDVETTHHDDGTMSMSVEDVQENGVSEYVYDALDVRLFIE
jgi:hypothetical protein